MAVMDKRDNSKVNDYRSSGILTCLYCFDTMYTAFLELSLALTALLANDGKYCP